MRYQHLLTSWMVIVKPEDEYTVYEVDGSDTDEEADLLNFDDLDSDEFV